MFCAKCGRKIDDGSAFCGYCGFRIKDALKPGNTPPSGNAGYKGRTDPGINIGATKWLIILIAEAIGLAAAAFLVFASVRSTRTPEKIAEKFFVSVVNGKYEEAFDCLQLEEDDLINVKSFQNMMAKENTDLSNVSNYRIVKNSYEDVSLFGYKLFETQSEDDSLGKTVDILYRNYGDDYDSHAEISLTRSGKGNWYVSSSPFLGSNSQVSVPRGASVSMNGTVLSSEHASDTTDDYGREITLYTLPKVFTGKHQISVEAQGREPRTCVWEIYGDNNNLDLTDMLYNDETMVSLQELARTNMYRIYSAALTGQSFDTIAGLFTADPDRLNTIRGDYENLQANLNEENRQIDAVNFLNINAESDTHTPAATLSFTAEVLYRQTDSWTGAVSNEVSDIDTSLYFEFTQENGSWVQTSLACEVLYF